MSPSPPPRIPCAKADLFLAACKAWQLNLDECIGALVWMTPTFNTYYDDLRDSLYGPNPTAYISESRVKDMRGIMGSLRLTYDAIDPELEKKDPALARQLRSEYDGDHGLHRPERRPRPKSPRRA